MAPGLQGTDHACRKYDEILLHKLDFGGRIEIPEDGREVFSRMEKKVETKE
jgi:hypothetical protein